MKEGWDYQDMENCDNDDDTHETVKLRQQALMTLKMSTLSSSMTSSPRKESQQCLWSSPLIPAFQGNPFDEDQTKAENIMDDPIARNDVDMRIECENDQISSPSYSPLSNPDFMALLSPISSPLLDSSKMSTGTFQQTPPHAFFPWTPPPSTPPQLDSPPTPPLTSFLQIPLSGDSHSLPDAQFTLTTTTTTTYHSQTAEAFPSTPFQPEETFLESPLAQINVASSSLARLRHADKTVLSAFLSPALVRPLRQSWSPEDLHSADFETTWKDALNVNKCSGANNCSPIILDRQQDPEWNPLTDSDLGELRNQVIATMSGKDTVTGSPDTSEKEISVQKRLSADLILSLPQLRRKRRFSQIKSVLFKERPLLREQDYIVTDIASDMEDEDTGTFKEFLSPSLSNENVDVSKIDFSCPDHVQDYLRMELLKTKQKEKQLNACTEELHSQENLIKRTIDSKKSMALMIESSMKNLKSQLEIIRTSLAGKQRVYSKQKEDIKMLGNQQEDVKSRLVDTSNKKLNIGKKLQQVEQCLMATRKDLPTASDDSFTVFLRSCAPVDRIDHFISQYKTRKLKNAPLTKLAKIADAIQYQLDNTLVSLPCSVIVAHILSLNSIQDLPSQVPQIKTESCEPVSCDSINVNQSKLSKFTSANGLCRVMKNADQHRNNTQRQGIEDVDPVYKKSMSLDSSIEEGELVSPQGSVDRLLETSEHEEDSEDQVAVSIDKSDGPKVYRAYDSPLTIFRRHTSSVEYAEDEALMQLYRCAGQIFTRQTIASVPLDKSGSSESFGLLDFSIDKLKLDPEPLIFAAIQPEIVPAYVSRVKDTRYFDPRLDSIEERLRNNPFNLVMWKEAAELYSKTRPASGCPWSAVAFRSIVHMHIYARAIEYLPRDTRVWIEYLSACEQLSIQAQRSLGDMKARLKLDDARLDNIASLALKWTDFDLCVAWKASDVSRKAVFEARDMLLKRSLNSHDYDRWTCVLVLLAVSMPQQRDVVLEALSHFDVVTHPSELGYQRMCLALTCHLYAASFHTLPDFLAYVSSDHTTESIEKLLPTGFLIIGNIAKPAISVRSFLSMVTVHCNHLKTLPSCEDNNTGRAQFLPLFAYAYNCMKVWQTLGATTRTKHLTSVLLDLLPIHERCLLGTRQRLHETPVNFWVFEDDTAADGFSLYIRFSAYIALIKANHLSLQPDKVQTVLTSSLSTAIGDINLTTTDIEKLCALASQKKSQLSEDLSFRLLTLSMARRILNGSSDWLVSITRYLHPTALGFQALQCLMFLESSEAGDAWKQLVHCLGHGILPELDLLNRGRVDIGRLDAYGVRIACRRMYGEYLKEITNNAPDCHESLKRVFGYFRKAFETSNFADDPNLWLMFIRLAVDLDYQPQAKSILKRSRILFPADHRFQMNSSLIRWDWLL